VLDAGWKIHQACTRAQKHEPAAGIGAMLFGEVPEWRKGLAWKASMRVDPVSRVRIPPSPHATRTPAADRQPGFLLSVGRKLASVRREAKTPSPRSEQGFTSLRSTRDVRAKRENPFLTRDVTQLARVAICLLAIPGHRDMPKGSYRANYLQQSWLHFKVTCGAPEALRALRRRRNVIPICSWQSFVQAA
jgi:hypothetical protein